MKSRENINISVRKQSKKRNKGIIYLRKSVIIDGKRVDKRLSTGLEATKANLRYVKKHGVELFNELLGLPKTDEKSTLFKDFYQEALNFLNVGVSEETQKRRLSNIRGAVLPTFEKKDIDKISPYDIEQWQTTLHIKKGGDFTSRVKSLLRRIFDRAKIKGLIVQNPCYGTAPVKKEKKSHREIYTKEEVSQMLNEADPFLKAFIYVMATLGLRTGETVGLRFSDFNPQDLKLHLQRSIRHGKISPPKTGERYIDVPERTMQTVAELKLQHDSEWLFPTKGGDHYYDGASINQKKFQPFLKKIGVKYKSLYSLRHFHATISLIEGQDLAYLSKQIGHANIKTTLDFYVGYLPNTEHKDKKSKIFDF